jgi:hypothetical protein
MAMKKMITLNYNKNDYNNNDNNRSSTLWFASGKG